MRSDADIPRTPYARGEADGLAGLPGPAFPKADAHWDAKLYNRGWEAGINRRAQAAALGMVLVQVDDFSAPLEVQLCR
ncbi:hypothetical protein IVB45_17335 [Bradyrhizobium sp. 4]|uniref:hypothetical protein n=1 Tax=unclassified Bradyrhizobium TaxID=2631580 RepID=UPI001FFA879E|nr:MULTISPECIES: hypothetical protein [unclassified Bradyrhizobium]MCK1402062.1 hypothetical protein [Bradyrhizobium sp. 39]MCK1751218.1 hypothetical protein [Bradyrhizobium sp. 135]UPJ38474.1 hypothetical protein IVB45_17335 [Bradyrhizobium sp. 4]